jgi:hypothetical protein
MRSQHIYQLTRFNYLHRDRAVAWVAEAEGADLDTKKSPPEEMKIGNS